LTWIRREVADRGVFTGARSTFQRICLGISQRIGLHLLLLVALVFIAACAHKPWAGGVDSSRTGTSQGPWSGRLSLQIQSEPPQAFFAAFELRGSAESGELQLTNPLGSVVARMRWSQAEAVLDNGGSLQRFGSVDDLLLRATGAPLSTAALFEWLQGRPASLAGWTADLSQHPAGKILARRNEPAPAVELRLVVEP
jgi:outer membrane lipoprotein LolB